MQKPARKQGRYTNIELIRTTKCKSPRVSKGDTLSIEFIRATKCKSPRVSKGYTFNTVNETLPCSMNTDLNSMRETNFLSLPRHVLAAIDYVLYSQGWILFGMWMETWEPPVK